MTQWAGILIITLIMVSSSFAETVRVAAAGNLQFVLPELIQKYPNSADQIDTTFASSGKLAAQIRKGAPYDIFMSANKAFPEKLIATGQTSSIMTVYATGKIVLWSLSVNVQNGLTTDIVQNINHMVIANPKYAPYGKGAMEWLTSSGMGSSLKKKLVNADNLAQAAHYVKSGAADMGIIALSQYVASPLKNTGTIFVPDMDTYAPIEQGMVQISPSAATHRFYLYLQSETAKSIFIKYGYGVVN